MKHRDANMVDVLDGPPPTAAIELERTTVAADQVRDFIQSATPGFQLPNRLREAPLTFSLALRRGHGPEVTISPRAFAIHGGHDIASLSPILIGEPYVVSGRVERVFTKTGRSGPMTIVERRVWIHHRDGALATEIGDRQIVRWKPDEVGNGAPSEPDSSRTENLPGSVCRELEGETSISAAASPAWDSAGAARATPPTPVPVNETLEIGDVVGPLDRPGPLATEISCWANALRDRETLFHDREGSQALGYRDLVVPGPMQSAMVDRLLAQALPDWRPARLSMTFRQSLIAMDPISIEAVVVDSEGATRSLDIVIRNARSGETTSIGNVELQRRRA